jgi:hypothetical protein
MIATKLETTLTAEPLRKEAVPELVHAAGPCVTFLLPPYRPGEAQKSAAGWLKTLLQEAGRKLAARQVPDPVTIELLKPLEHLSHQEESLAGVALGRVIFRSPGVFRQFELHVPPAPAMECSAGDCFHIRPALPSLALPANVYVLEISKTGVRLLECGRSGVRPVELPRGTPKTLQEAMAFDAPDHELVNRSSAGPSVGSMPGVQFGTGSGREREAAHLHDFYRAVDRGVTELLRWNQAPLVLAGVEEDLILYRSLSAYSNLSKQGIHGSRGAALDQTQVLRQAHDIALFDLQSRAAHEMADSKERLSPARFSSDIQKILRAAVEGRVRDLYLDENAHLAGDFDGRVFGGRANWHAEDLLNVAAVEVLRCGGTVFSLPSHLMAGGPMAAAAFRY